MKVKFINKDDPSDIIEGDDHYLYIETIPLGKDITGNLVQVQAPTKHWIREDLYKQRNLVPLT